MKFIHFQSYSYSKSSNKFFPQNVNSILIFCSIFLTIRLPLNFQVLFEKLEEQDIDGFTDAVKEYDSISRLDQWFTTILLRIKKSIQDTPDLR